jgi:hypothetical protein
MATHKKRHHSSHKKMSNSEHLKMSETRHMREDRGTGMGMNREMNPRSREFYADDNMIHDAMNEPFNLPQDVMRKTYRNPSRGLPGELEYGIDEVNRNQDENPREFRKQFKMSRS